jgi:hypothetical protein
MSTSPGTAPDPCRIADDDAPEAFEVTYRYGDRLYRRTMTQRPGERLRVRVQFTPGQVSAP